MWVLDGCSRTVLDAAPALQVELTPETVGFLLPRINWCVYVRVLQALAEVCLARLRTSTSSAAAFSCQIVEIRPTPRSQRPPCWSTCCMIVACIPRWWSQSAAELHFCARKYLPRLLLLCARLPVAAAGLRTPKPGWACRPYGAFAYSCGFRFFRLSSRVLFALLAFFAFLALCFDAGRSQVGPIAVKETWGCGTASCFLVMFGFARDYARLIGLSRGASEY